MAKILEVCSGPGSGANRFDSFYSVGAPAKRFYCLILRWIAAINHVAGEEFDVEFFRIRWHRDPSLRERVACLAM